MSGRWARSVLIGLAFCALALVLAVSDVRAATTLYFDDTGGPKNWDSTTADWSTTGSSGSYNQLWSDGSYAYFGGTPGIVNIPGAVSPGSTVNFFPDGYTLGASPNAGAINLYPITTITTLTGTTTINSVLSGASAGLTKNGVGTLVLNGDNTFAGGTGLGQGTVRLGSQNALQNSTVSWSGGTGTLSFGTLGSANLGGLAANPGYTIPLSNDNSQPVALTVGSNNQSTTCSATVTGGGSLTKAGTGKLILAASSTYAGPTTLNSGILQLGVQSVGSVGSITSSPVGIGTFVLNGGQVCANDNSTPRTLYNPVTVGGNVTLGDTVNSGIVVLAGPMTLAGGDRTLTVNGGAARIDGSIGDGGHGYGLVKSGFGPLILAGTNTYSGTTTISNGLLDLENFDALQNSTLNVGVSNALAYGYNTGTFTLGGLSGIGDVTLTNSGNNAVTLRVGNNGQSTSFSGRLSGSGSLTKIGTGTLTLSAANSYTGTTTVSAGTLTLDTAGSLLLDINPVGQFTQILGNGTLNLNGTINFDVTDVTGTAGSWAVVDVAHLTESYGGSFAVKMSNGSAFTPSGNNWTYTESSGLGRTWTFSETSGVLSVGVVPEPSTLALLAVGSLGVLLFARRKRRPEWTRTEP